MDTEGGSDLGAEDTEGAKEDTEGAGVCMVGNVWYDDEYLDGMVMSSSDFFYYNYHVILCKRENDFCDCALCLCCYILRDCSINILGNSYCVNSYLSKWII